jgi:DNA-binding transcriptional MerR regulator
MTQRIGQVAKATGIGPRTIRFYEAAGVLPAPGRSPSGYRQYTPEEVGRLLFVRRARVLGLSLPRLKDLLAALDDGRTAVRPRVREVVRAHLATVQGQIRDLLALEGQLRTVLRRIARRSHVRTGGPCRCLDLDAPPTPRERRDTRRR